MWNRCGGGAPRFPSDGGLNAAEAEEGTVGCAGAAMPAGGASGTEAAEEGGTSGTDTPWGEAAEGASGIDKLSKPTALKRGISRQTRCAQICGTPWCLAREIPAGPSGGLLRLPSAQSDRIYLVDSARRLCGVPAPWPAKLGRCGINAGKQAHRL